MKDSGAPYSGKFDFIKTEMSWPITHMVAPKEKAMGCVECHSKDGRLAGIQGVYLPPRQQQAGRHRRLGHRPPDAARRHRTRRPAHRHRPQALSLKEKENG
jgi:hypothetical protein